MICKNCGAEIADGSTFCTQCGAPVQQEQPQPTPVQQAYNAAVSNPALNSTPILILGIIALALCAYVIPGIICGFICKSKVKAYQEAGGVLTGKAKVGSILGKVGLILSFVFIGIWLIYLIVIIATGAMTAFNYSNLY